MLQADAKVFCLNNSILYQEIYLDDNIVNYRPKHIFK